MPYHYDGPDSFVIHNGFNFDMRLLAALDTLIGSTPDDRATQRWDRHLPSVEVRLNRRRAQSDLAKRSINHAGQAYLE